MEKQNQLIAVTQSMSSLQIAEITNKRHDVVLRDIRNLLEQGVNAHNFVEVEYTDKKGETRPCYQLTKKGCLILASGYNAVLREKIIDRWEELESGKATPMAFQVPQTFSQALMLAAKQQEQIEQQQQLLLAQGNRTKSCIFQNNVLTLQRGTDNGCTHFAEQRLIAQHRLGYFFAQPQPIGGCLYVDKSKLSEWSDHICYAAYRRPLFYVRPHISLTA